MHKNTSNTDTHALTHILAKIKCQSQWWLFLVVVAFCFQYVCVCLLFASIASAACVTNIHRYGRLKFQNTLERASWREHLIFFLFVACICVEWMSKAHKYATTDYSGYVWTERWREWRSGTFGILWKCDVIHSFSKQMQTLREHLTLLQRL